MKKTLHKTQFYKIREPHDQRNHKFSIFLFLICVFNSEKSIHIFNKGIFQ